MAPRSRTPIHSASPHRRRLRTPARAVEQYRIPTPADVIGAAKLQAADIALVTDRHQRILHVTDAFTAITGYRLDEVVGRTCAFLQGAGTDSAVIGDMRRVLGGGKSFEGELLNYRKDGSAFWNALKVLPMRLGESNDVTHFVSVQRDVSNRVALLEQLRIQALRDQTTGLPNRLAADQAAEAALRRRRPPGSALLIGLVDLDDFRLINNAYGHAAGDGLLVAWADRMRSHLSDDDVLARMDGDEFLLILERNEGDDHAVAAELDRLCRVVEAPFEVGVYEMTLGMSMGVAAVRCDGIDHRAVLQACDEALYRVKSQRDSRERPWQFTDEGAATNVLPAVPVSPERPRRISLQDIRWAFTHDGVEPHFQPVVDLRSGCVNFFEALARLRLADGSLAQPHEFLPQLTALDERTLFRLVLDKALAALHEWDEVGDEVQVSINISPVVLRDIATPGIVAEALVAHRVSASRLSLEILESQVMDLDIQRAAIDELVRLGVSLSMDDLAAGHSSLQRLASFPFTALKLDRGLFDGVRDKPLETLSIIATLIQMGRDLSMGVVVEGLEHEDLTEAAIILGAPLGQGYFFERPLPVEECQDWMHGFELTLHQSPIQTLLGALAYHWQFGRLNVAHPLPLHLCPLTRFITDLAPTADVGLWHERQHLETGMHPASSRSLISWLTREIGAQGG